MTVRNYKYTAILCFIGAFMGPFGGNVVNVLIPRLQNEFATSFYNISLSISVYMLAFAGFQLISGFISDLIGRRNIVLFGYGGFGLGCLICLFAGSLNLFLTGRFIQGMSNAFMTPVLMAMLGDIVPKRSLGRYMGVFGSIQTSGIFIAPILGGIFAEINWRYVFLLLAVLSFLLTFIYFKTFAYTSSVKRKKSISGPVYSILVNNRDTLWLALSSFAGYFGFGSLGFLFAKYIYLNFNVSESINGIIVSLTGLANIFFSLLAGRLVDRFNRAKVCIAGVVSIIPLIFSIPYINNIYTLSAILFLIGGFSSAVWSSINTMAVDTYPEIRGTVSSIINSFKYFSFSISPVFYGIMYETGGMKAAFVAASGVTLIQFIIMLIYSGYSKKVFAH